MEPHGLTTEDTLALLELVDAAIETTLDQLGNYTHAIGGLYPATWELGSLDSSGIERAAWLLSQLGFSIGDIDIRSVPSDLGGIANEFYTVSASRMVSFQRYSLLGEALIVESVAATWATHIDRFFVHSDGESHRVAMQSLHGPFGSKIM